MSLFGLSRESLGGRSDREFFETLERRIVLSAVDGLPDLADMETPDNPVVLLDTSEGDIFLELFQLDAPNTVANFIEHVERGLFGESFFHRLAPGFVLQGGGFRFSEERGFDAVFDPDLGPIENEFGRSNLERTIAMAKLGGDPDSATSQFFVNLADNSGNLDNQNGGFTVFGRVLDDASWDVVQSIAGLNTQNLTQDSAFFDPDPDGDPDTDDGMARQLEDPFGRPLFNELDQAGQPTGFQTLEDTGDPATGASAMGQVPVRDTFDSNDGFLEEDQVDIVNAQVVKPFDVDPGLASMGPAEAFFDQLQVLPEGFASPSSTVTLDLANPNAEPVEVQALVRYETSVRDQVLDIASLIDQADGEEDGKLAANTSVQIAVHDPATLDPSLVRLGEPFAFEVYTAAPSGLDETLPVAASLNHFDFEGALGEGFIDVTDQATRGNMEESGFGAIPLPLEGERSFIVWQNLSDADTTVTVDFFQRNGSAPVSLQFELDAYRRGGVDVGTILEDLQAAGIDVENDTVGAVVSASEPIAAMISAYQSQDGAPFALGARGVPGGGSSVGLIPGVTIPSSGEASFVVVNGNDSGTPVTLQAILSDGTLLNVLPPETAAMPARSARAVDLASTFPSIPADTFFTLRYIAGPVPLGLLPVAAHVSVGIFDGEIDEVVASPVQTVASEGSFFADGFFDFLGDDPLNPTDTTREFVSVFNPFQDRQVNVQFDFLFSDGERISTPQVTIDANSRRDEFTELIVDVVNKVDSGDFTNFAIEVRGFETDGVTPAPITTVIHRLDTLGTLPFEEVLGATPSLFGNVVALNDPLFQGGTPG